MKTFLPSVVVRCLLSSLLSLFSFAAVAQTQSPSKQPMPPSAYKLISVEVTGSKRFTSEDVAAASGLPMGTVAHEDDFKKAARQLGESGAFTNIAFTFSYSSAGTRLEFQVTDADKFVPVHLADFVWFTDAELLRKLHERIPLFKGDVPIDGRLLDEVSDVLQAMLVEKAVPGHVEYLRHSGKTGQLESVNYNVAGVSIRIHHVEFPGAGPGELPLLQAAAGKIIEREYSRDYMENFVEHSLLPIFHEHGFLKAACAPAQPKVVKADSPEARPNQQPPTYVDVVFPVTPGVSYNLTRWEWSNNKEFPTETLQAMLHVKAGQPANTVQLAEDLRAVQELYASRGYVTATIKADGQFDDAGGAAVFDLVVTEGPVFHMGELEFRGIDNNLTARLRAAWKLRPGDVYDASYLKEFLPLARKLLPATLDWEVATHVTALAHDKTVDVDLQYTAKAPQ